ncbi:nuclear transport factor 2 family protein [uncultured Alsobacter sp.]|uniref:nuclear transport factor 2 family protein n=1 Tax=uncultured Alsobacter sp. TaxID=1748258 RepID=UPI0025D15073|nr:nuclear transport factor 2 family protein [uncultured Alsobacter sp.]
MAFDGPPEDRLAIRERLDAYGDAVMRKDVEAWIACWADDATWVIRGQTLVGLETIRSAWLKAMERYAFVGFYTAQAAVAITGDVALSQAHTLEFLVSHDGAERRQHGFYRDRLVRHGSAWLFAERAFDCLHPPSEPQPRSLP